MKLLLSLPLFLSTLFFTSGLEATQRLSSGSHHGEMARLGQFPYLVALEQKYRKNKYYFVCAGALIAIKYVLTAAHCVSNNPMRARVGILRLIDDDKAGETIKVEKVFVHPEFNEENVTNDIAVLRLVSNVSISNEIKPIKLPRQRSNPSGIAVVSGWGRLFSNDLKYLKVNILPFKDCLSAVRAALGNRSRFYYDNKMLCSISKDNEVCNGSSGSPLVQTGKLIGFVSWTTLPCGEKKHPLVFTRVSKHIEWIKQQIVT